MPFIPDKEFPDLSRLLASLNNSKISITNNALYQTIFGLIQKVEQLKDLSVTELQDLQIAIDNLTSIVNNLSIGSIISGDKAWMPVFDGEDGEPGFPIPGPQGPRGNDGKPIYFGPDEQDYCEPPYLGPNCCGDPQASEFSSSTTGTINDLDFANASILRFTGASAITITGIKAGKAGQRVTIFNLGGSTLRIADQDGGSSAANQFLCPSVRGQIIGDTGAINLAYDGTTAKWRQVSVEPGDHITVPFNAGDFTAAGGVTWTVAAGDITAFKYVQMGKKVTVFATIVTTDVSAPTASLIILIPNSFSSVVQVYNGAEVVDNGTVLSGYFNVSGTSIAVTRSDNAAWAAAAGTTSVLGETTFEVN